MVADPDLSQSLMAWQMRADQEGGPRHLDRLLLEWGKTLRNLLILAEGRPNTPRSVRLAVA
jgi:hypothetical protein